MPASTRKILFRSFWGSLLSVMILLAGAWFGGRMWLAQSQMAYEGELRLGELSAPVEIFFDARGIPRIYAQTDRDLMVTLGWLHAGERLFQMELIRRMASGELSALFGPAALEFDVLNRGFGFARRVADDPPQLDAETSGLIEAYVRGINSRIQSDEPLPPEFLILGHDPRPWTQADVLSIAYYQSFFPLTLVQQVRDAYLTVTEHFGPEAGDWLRSLSANAMTSLPSLRMTEASNTWVVGPGRSESGAALHASDPHLEFNTAPGLWYAAGLHSQENINALGVTAPGLPFIAMGHNGQIAWAFTVAPVDLFELYRLKRNPDHPEQLMGPNGWTDLHTETEDILVRGQEAPYRQSYQYTAFGKVLESTATDVLVLRWAGFELPVEPLIRQGLAINQSQNFDQFRQAASDMGALSVNWSYSDRDGNIGYVQSTPVPVRAHEDFYQVLDGADPRYHWQGFHPPKDRPFVLNPALGWLANANNLAAGPDWPYALPGFYYQDRIRRASDLLASQRLLDQADMTRFQLDLISDRALAWKGWLAETAERTGRGIIAQDLRDWDGQMRADSDVAGLFARWWGYLPRALFDAADQADGRPDWQALRPLTDRWLRDPDRPSGLASRDPEQAAELAFEEALRAGARPLGLIQTLEVQHPLAQSGLLNSWLRLSRGPFGVGGDSASLNATFSRFDTGSALWEARSGASMRFVMDWADPDAFTLNLAMGQSGHPLSPHFDSFLNDFLTGEAWRVPWSRAAVERRAASKRVLRPE